MTDAPVLRVIAGGQPSDEETAALTAVLVAVASAGVARDEQPVASSRWRDSSRPGTSRARTGWLSRARASALRRQQ